MKETANNDPLFFDDDNMSTGFSKSSEESGDAVQPLAHRESIAVKRSKMLVFVVLLLAAVAVAVPTYMLSAKVEKDAFDEDIDTFAEEIGEAAETHRRSILGALRGLNTAYTAFAVSSQQSWPNVTLPFFEARTMEARKLSGARVLVFAPLVPESHKQEWEAYSVKHQDWIAQGLEFQGTAMKKDEYVSSSIPSKVVPFGTEESTTGDENGAILAPVWQTGAAPSNPANINVDLYSHPTFARMMQQVLKTKESAVSEILDLSFLYKYSTTAFSKEEEGQEDGNEEQEDEESEGSIEEHRDEPHACIIQPVLDTIEKTESSKVVGFMIAVFPWSLYYKNDELIHGMYAVLTDKCGSTSHTYFIDQRSVEYLGPRDLHEVKFNYLGRHRNFELGEEHEDEEDDEDRFRSRVLGGKNDDEGHRDENDDDSSMCTYEFHIYPSNDLYETYITDKPAIYASVVVIILFCTSLVFILYDILVQRRQNLVMRSATNANAVVSNLFPESMQKRILLDAEEKIEQKTMMGGKSQQLTSFLEDGKGTTPAASKPIADLFPEVTIMYADISGFTAWSSAREPSQVFTLLETIYSEFDVCARKRKVFKIETIGDCYVAAAGLPEPRKDHFLVLARFATDCARAMARLSKQLDVLLGPDTSNLNIRIGLNSGPVTAGILRGEKMRFQCFGDTVETAAKMESSGEAGKIQVSQQTADLLIAAGKSEWLQPRETTVKTNRKGALQTYWLKIGQDRGEEGSSLTASISMLDDLDQESKKTDRLVAWSSDLLIELLQEVANRREATKRATTFRLDKESSLRVHKAKMPLDEVREIITLPKFDVDVAEAQKKKMDQVQLDPVVKEEVRDYMQTIASRYRDNPFHNFSHACHVSMSVVKLLSRIVAPDHIEASDKSLHDHTYGITSDPLTRFACVLSALIHDVDHCGVSNVQLVTEGAKIASKYNEKSIAEQNSVDLGWDLLMNDGRFSNFRKAIFTTNSELKRFRELIINSVMATDIMDKELKQLRNNRWDKAFAEKPMYESHENDVNRKATIVIEHLIQASDVSHTMQHWKIYQQWNHRLFFELYFAHRAGRMEKSPVDFWYQGEIGFFDYYLIPLAKKLKDCGVFGVSSFEYLNYAQENREEWAEKGEAVVAELKQKAEVIWERDGNKIMERMKANIAELTLGDPDSTGGIGGMIET